jgi:hypothetical protein
MSSTSLYESNRYVGQNVRRDMLNAFGFVTSGGDIRGRQGTMVDFDTAKCMFSGPQGTLRVPVDDEITRKLAMLIDGECMGPGPKQAAEKYGFSRQRYFQLRTAFREHGALGLVSQRRGPKTHYRRSKEVVCQAIRHRFLDPDASSAVIVQKLRQCGFEWADAKSLRPP